MKSNKLGVGLQTKFNYKLGLILTLPQSIKSVMRVLSIEGVQKVSADKAVAYIFPLLVCSLWR